MAKAKGNPKKHSKLADLYEKDGDGVKNKTKSCPKCGEGTFMGKHKDRYSCGKCHYTEFTKH